LRISAASFGQDDGFDGAVQPEVDDDLSSERQLQTFFKIKIGTMCNSK
jgi:hypothetical protein